MASMEQTVAPGTGLTTRQKQFLGLVLEEPFLLKTFYLSGGTALASWYLHHRESYDLDFFSDEPFRKDALVRWVIAEKKRLGYSSYRYEEDWGFSIFFFHYLNNEVLKVDFNHYGAVGLQQKMLWKGLRIDSLYDIAVNKIQTVATAPRARDYIDLYYILKKKDWSVNALLGDAAIKFSIRIDAFDIAKNFLKVTEFLDLPRMLVPFERNTIEQFYFSLARNLKKDILK